MRVTGLTVRRRNHAWLQMRSLERRAARLARRQEHETDSSDDADTSGAESASSIGSPDDESNTEPTKTVRPPLASVTNTPSPTISVTGSKPSEDAQDPPSWEANERQGNALSVGSAPKNNLGAGALAGIVIGVLAFITLLAGAALLWRKRRRDRGLPFLPQPRFRLQEDDKSLPPSVTGPLAGRVGGHNPAKTNTQIMDDLMRAAYATENGMNNMEGAFAPAIPKPPPQQMSAFMDEKAYATLAGLPTPATSASRWLDGVKTPTQPNGPEIPPTLDMRASGAMPMMSG